MTSLCLPQIPPQGLSSPILKDSPQPQPLRPHHSFPQAHSALKIPGASCLVEQELRAAKPYDVQGSLVRRAILLSASASTVPPFVWQNPRSTQAATLH